MTQDTKIDNVDWFGQPPPNHVEAIKAILDGPPSILLFRHYHWLTKKPVPPRHNLQTNDEYVSRNWWRLVRAAREYVIDSSGVVSSSAPSHD